MSADICRSQDQINSLVCCVFAVKISVMASEGFEPSHPKILDLKSSALDHSAKKPEFVAVLLV